MTSCDTPFTGVAQAINFSSGVVITEMKRSLDHRPLQPEFPPLVDAEEPRARRQVLHVPFEFM